MEKRNLLDAEFKILIIKMPNECRGRVNELSENFNREIRNIKMELEKNQSEIRNALTEIKTILQGN